MKVVFALPSGITTLKDPRCRATIWIPIPFRTSSMVDSAWASTATNISLSILILGFRYGSDGRITVISAGTLCGGAAYGFKRAYNVVELDTETMSGLPACQGDAE